METLSSQRSKTRAKPVRCRRVQRCRLQRLAKVKLGPKEKGGCIAAAALVVFCGRWDA